MPHRGTNKFQSIDSFISAYILLSLQLNYMTSSLADKKNYCDRVDQSVKLGMQVRFGIYSSIRRGAKKICLIKTHFLKCAIFINS